MYAGRDYFEFRRATNSQLPEKKNRTEATFDPVSVYFSLVRAGGRESRLKSSSASSRFECTRIGQLLFLCIHRGAS